MKKIDVAADFSKFPAGRFLADGPNSGQRFRDQLLVPALATGEVQVLLDGTLGYGSSFLEEAFGGLVRISNIPGATIERNLKLVSHDAILLQEIWGYIRTAAILGKMR